MVTAEEHLWEALSSPGPEIGFGNAAVEDGQLVAEALLTIASCPRKGA